MKALIFWALSLLMIAASASAQVIKEDNPYRLLEQVAEKTFARIAEERDRINEDPNYLKTVVREELMPYVDNIYASKKVLGRYFKDTSRRTTAGFLPSFYRLHCCHLCPCFYTI